MHPSELARRRAAAQRRIDEALGSLAAARGIEVGPQRLYGNDRAARELQRLEHIASLAEALAGDAPSSASAPSDGGGTVRDVTERIAATEDIEAVKAIGQEEANGKARKGVLDAVDRRIAELEAAEGAE